nr:RNA-dependent RNA polymerase [Tolivirales sp.]
MSNNNKGRKVGKAGMGPRKQQPMPKRQNKSKSEPVAVVSRSGPRVPRTRQVLGGTVVSHTETYGVNVTGSAPFAIFSTWAIQPGLREFSRGAPLGAWLGQIAQNFDNYEIQKLKFKFRTACSTLTTGLAVFGYEPNPEGSLPTTYQEIRNMLSVDGSVHANLEFDVSSKVNRRLLIRKSNVVNLPSYDAGKVYFATIGVNDNSLVGFIDVEYQVKLVNPQSAVTTSDPVPVVVYKAPPTQRTSVVYASSNLGDTNVVGSGDGPCNVMGANAANEGASLMDWVANDFQAHEQDFNGCKFKTDVRASGYWSLKPRVAGRYRLKLNAKIGYEDLKMFCIAPFRKRNPGEVEQLCTYTVYNQIDGGTVASLPVEIFNHRGFTGVATLDPNPGTEVWPAWEWVVDVVPADYIRFKFGYLTYNSVSTTTANVRGYDGLGKSTLTIEYLGPSASAA